MNIYSSILQRPQPNVHKKRYRSSNNVRLQMRLIFPVNVKFSNELINFCKLFNDALEIFLK
jgi:hypothetical protein